MELCFSFAITVTEFVRCHLFHSFRILSCWYAGELITSSEEDISKYFFFRFIALIESKSSVSLILTNFAFSLPFSAKTETA